MGFLLSHSEVMHSNSCEKKKIAHHKIIAINCAFNEIFILKLTINDHFFIKYFKRCGDLIGIGIINLQILLSINLQQKIHQKYFLCKNLIHSVRRQNQNCSIVFILFDAGKLIQ